jgi:hypothetical protein
VRGWIRPVRARAEWLGVQGSTRGGESPPLAQAVLQLTTVAAEPGRGVLGATTRRSRYLLRLVTTVSAPSAPTNPPPTIRMKMSRSSPTGLRVS